MKTIEIDISKGWMPDLIPFKMPEGSLIDCKNLLPYEEAFKPMPGKVAYSSDAVAGTPLYAEEFQASDGTRYVFIGSTTKLNRMETNKSLSDISKVATTYTSSVTRWHLAKYNEWIIATNYADVPQVLKGLTAANYVDLGGSPPKAKYAVFSNGHLMLLYLNEGGTVDPRKVIWSAYENVENFTQSLTTRSDSKVLRASIGKITGAALVNSIIAVFHERSITTAWYMGAPAAFDWNENAVKNIGAIEGTIVSEGNLVRFFDDKDIYKFDGVNAIPIGAGVRNTLVNDIHMDYLYRNSTANDLKNGLTFWSYASVASTDGTPDTILCYNSRTGVWSYIEMAHHCLFNLYRAALNMDNMDTEYPSIDDIPFSLDTNFWQQSTVVACMNTDGKVNILTGAVMTGNIETREVAMPDNYIYLTDRIRPKIQKPTKSAISAKIGYRNTEDEEVSYSDSATLNDEGFIDIMQAGRFLRCQLTTGLHQGIRSIDIEAMRLSKY